jgi:hypothetical protein
MRSRKNIQILCRSSRRLIDQALYLCQRLQQNCIVSLPGVEQHLAAAAEQLNRVLHSGWPGESQRGVADMAQHLVSIGNDVSLPRGPATQSASQSAAQSASQSASQPAQAKAMRFLHGSAPTPDVITFVCSLRKTGHLRIETDDECFTIELGDGEVLHAHSSGAPTGSRLGEILVELGMLRADELEPLLVAGSTARLGARLLELGLVTKEQLAKALALQIRRLFRRLFVAVPREIAFFEGPPLLAEPAMRFNATMLLLEGARQHDETRA